jgi:4'-phosphopantetheinyl transferase
MRNPLVHPLTTPADFHPGVALWLVDLDAAPAAWDAQVLSEPERAQAQRFRFEVHARRYVSSHVALRQLLADHTGQSPSALQFSDGSHGKPRLQAADKSTRPHFNMSHSGGWALVGICTSHPIGVDIELLTSMTDTAMLAQHNFSAAENAAFQQTRPDDQQEAFLRCWTRKEACLKALGSGLSIAPNEFEAGLEHLPRSTFIAVDDQPCTMRVCCIDLPIQGLAAVARLDDPDSPLAM